MKEAMRVNFSNLFFSTYVGSRGYSVDVPPPPLFYQQAQWSIQVLIQQYEIFACILKTDEVTVVS